MPIYKGTNEVTSGNLYKGSTEIENGYKAADSFYVNETTLTIIFVDNTATGSSLNSTSSAVFTGSPGSAFSTFNRSVNRTNGTYAVTGASVSEAGDSGNNVSTSVSGSGNVSRNISISGTIPTTTKTITLTVNSTVNTLLARNMSFNSTGSPSPTPWANWVSYGIASGGSTWNGGGTATASMGPSVTDVMYSIDAVAGGSFVTGPCGSSVSQSGMSSGFAPSFRAMQCNSATTPSVTATLTLSIGETSTYQAGSVSTNFTWT
jgi:hypothetical protein